MSEIQKTLDRAKVLAEVIEGAGYGETAFTLNALSTQLSKYREALEEARDDLGKVIGYPFASQDEMEKHVEDALSRIEAVLGETK